MLHKVLFPTDAGYNFEIESKLINMFHFTYA
jgi:hypothetical protein